MWLLPHLLPPFPSVNSTGDTQEDWERQSTYWWEKGRGGDVGGAKSYDGGKAWPSINHSKLSGSSPIAVMKIMRIIQWWNIVHVVTVMFFKKNTIQDSTKNAKINAKPWVFPNWEGVRFSFRQPLKKVRPSWTWEQYRSATTLKCWCDALPWWKKSFVNINN